MVPPIPAQQHQWLQQLVGEWTMEIEADMGPGEPLAKHKGTEIVRPLGDVWVVCEGTGDNPAGDPNGEPHRSVMSLGFDPNTNRFIGTFMSSMSTHLWIYNGQLDAAGKMLTLDTEGPSFSQEEKMCRYQDSIIIKSPNERLLTSKCETATGVWQDIMAATYRRKK